MSTVVRWTPTRTPNRHVMDRFFEDLWKPFPFEERANSNGAATPAIDVIENDTEVQVVVSLPGVAPENVSLEFNKNVLTISTPATPADEATNYTRRERYHSGYQRALNIPETLDANQAKAHFENGVLTLTLPKKPEAQPVRIPVNAASPA